MASVEFTLNDKQVYVADPDPTLTLLEWLRESRMLTGTKEGCNEGDCGACTVIVTGLENGRAQSRAVNSCILFVPQIDGKAVRTIEGVSAPDGRLHPVQQAMIDNHGSQCGFCTPGFVMSMVAAHANGNVRHDDALAGNLCRCTGYAPIVRAAGVAANQPRAEWLESDLTKVSTRNSSTTSERMFIPANSDELADWYMEHPHAILVAGATDVGLWVTKQFRRLPLVCFVSQVPELQTIKTSRKAMEFGAAATLDRVREAVAERHPSFAELLRRFGSEQVRSSATIGGNIANGSPIGDCAPALIALGAELKLRRGADRRIVKLEHFFVDYGVQDLAEGEFVESVLVPKQADRLKCYKLSKRFDQDISAVCGCIYLRVAGGRVAKARIAFGGMAAIPKRAREAERALENAAWDQGRVEAAMNAMEVDFAPISDMRASARYRMEAAKNMLLRYFLEDTNEANSLQVLEVRT